MTTLPQTSIAAGGGSDLSPDAIERTLRELWREVEAQEAEVTQVRMLNLLVYLQQPPPLAMRTAINAVAVQHPGRTITLIYEDAPPRVEATIACRVTGDRQHACGEQITLRGSVDGHPLHSLAIALLQAGLPITVWWHGPFDLDDHVFQQLAKVADHVVLDSRTWPDPLPLLSQLAQAAKESERRLRFSDLQWVDLTTWRRPIAHAFDLPAARSALPTLSDVEIDFGGEAPASVAALLLVGWLASRLGWDIGVGAARRDAGGFVLPLRRADGELRITLRRRDAEEGIVAVRMVGGGERPARFGFEVTPDGHCVKTCIEMGTGAPLIQTSQLHRRGPADLLGEELTFTSGDPVYLAALQAAVRLVESLPQAL